MEPVLLLGKDRFAGVDIRVRVKGGGHISQLYGMFYFRFAAWSNGAEISLHVYYFDWNSRLDRMHMPRKGMAGILFTKQSLFISSRYHLTFCSCPPVLNSFVKFLVIHCYIHS